MKPPNAKARALFQKLQALAERGIEGEKAAAQAKLALLKTRFDFGGADSIERLDLFRGRFKRSTTARLIFSFKGDEFDVANSVKWAIESSTKIQCLYRDAKLLAEADAKTCQRLSEIAIHIAVNFRALIKQFSAIAGVTVGDRTVFVRGLYDGMMNQVRNAGQPLPSRAVSSNSKGRKQKKKPAADTPGLLHIHPYTVAVSLGKQIRLSTPLEQISAELDAVTRRHLPTSA